MKILKQLLVLFIIVAVPVWLWVRYEDKDFLRYGALHIYKTPKSLNLIHDDSYGMSDFRAEYYFSIDSSEFNKLLAGRKYTLKPSDYVAFRSDAVNKHFDVFKITQCYTTGTLGTGLTNIYTNDEKKLAYVVYSID